jgi:hypothetical protein
VFGARRSAQSRRNPNDPGSGWGIPTTSVEGMDEDGFRFPPGAGWAGRATRRTDTDGWVTAGRRGVLRRGGGERALVRVTIGPIGPGDGPLVLTQPPPPALAQNQFPYAIAAITAAILSRISFHPSSCPLFFALSMGSFPMKVSFV